MLKRFYAFWVVLCLCVGVLLSNISYAKGTEKLSINKQGIKVWTQQIKDNPMMHYRAETTLNTSIENAVGLILDTDRGKTWIPYVTDIQVIDRDDAAGEFVIYIKFDFPFPLNDRDLVVKGKMSKNNKGQMIVKNTAIKDPRVPLKNNVIRITHYEGDWVLTKLSAKQVKVSTSGFADPAGSIPTSFVNTFVEQQPYQMLQRMKQYVKTVKYSSDDLPSALR